MLYMKNKILNTWPNVNVNNLINLTSRRCDIEFDDADVGILFIRTEGVVVHWLGRLCVHERSRKFGIFIC